MAYTDYVITTPDPTTQTPGQAFTSDRQNLLALRDGILFGAGFLPGWNCHAENADNTEPPDNPEKPAQLKLFKSQERIKIALTWTGDNVTRIVCSYSANNGSTWDVVKGGTTNGYYNITYDANGNFLYADWS